jgi:hypothetical protein
MSGSLKEQSLIFSAFLCEDADEGILYRHIFFDILMY